MSGLRGSGRKRVSPIVSDHFELHFCSRTAFLLVPRPPPRNRSLLRSPALITLEEAIHRAQANEPGYAAATANSRVAALDRSMARAGLLPSVIYHNQYLYTEPNG